MVGWIGGDVDTIVEVPFDTVRQLKHSCKYVFYHTAHNCIFDKFDEQIL